MHEKNPASVTITQEAGHRTQGTMLKSHDTWFKMFNLRIYQESTTTIAKQARRYAVAVFPP